MKKIFIFFISMIYLNGCSCFVGSRQNVSIMTNVPNSKIFANGEMVGHGTAIFSAKRNQNVQIMAQAEGYYPAYSMIDSNLSTTGILDLVGIFVWLVPFIGLLTPGSKALDRQNVAVELVPVQQVSD